jgi:hypothetical protein
MDLKQQYEFDLNGFLVVHEALSHVEVMALSRILAGVRGARRTGKFSFFDLDSVFADLMARSQTLEIVRALCGEWVRFDHAFGIRMAREEPCWQGLHGGDRASQGAFAYQWVRGRMYNGLIKVLYTLTDVNPGDGGFVCVPGSHKANVDFKPAGDSHLVINPGMRAGDMLVFTEALLHGSRAWKGAEPRIALIYSYAPGCLVWKDPRTLAHYAHSVFTDAQRDLFRPPFVGDYEEAARTDDSGWPSDRRTPTRIL